MNEFKIDSEFIKLDQFLKFSNIASSGAEAKILVKEGLVKLNGEVEIRRGKKLYPGDVVEFDEEKFFIK